MPPAHPKRPPRPSREDVEAVAHIAHEFSNLLTRIMALCEVARLGPEDTDPGQDPIEEIELAALRAADLTADLLGIVAPPEPGDQSVLPLVDDDTAESSPLQVDRTLAEAAGTECVLLVEDDAEVQELLEGALLRAGYTVHTARDGLEALHLFRRLGDDVDILVSDIVIPGLSGPKLAARLREFWPRLPVLLVSGLPGEAPSKMDPAAHHTAMLQKPFAPAALCAQVRRLLDAAAKS